MSRVSLRNLSAKYHGNLIVDDVNLEIGSGEFIVLLGPSGCGKTTTLRLIAGFVQPAAGKILFDGVDVTGYPPRKREIGMVFQNYALFPTMTVEQNIAFPLRHRKVQSSDIRRRVDELIDLMQLKGLAKSYPDELSGGQQQRVALARALAASPKLLLMDEPLGALDQKLRDNLQLELHKLQRDLGITTLLVTHDQQEAMLLADRIVVMAEGRIQQIGTPLDLYRNPANHFVADFIGKSNIVTGTVERRAGSDFLVTSDNAVYPIKTTSPAQIGKRASLVIRPENIFLRPLSPGNADRLCGSVERRLFLGNIVQYFVRLPSGMLLQSEQHGGADQFSIGDTVELSWDVSAAPVFIHDES